MDESQDPQGYAGIGEGDASDSEQSQSEAKLELLGINNPKAAEVRKAGAGPEQSGSAPKPTPKEAAKVQRHKKAKSLRLHSP